MTVNWDVIWADASEERFEACPQCGCRPSSGELAETHGVCPNCRYNPGGGE